MVSVNINDDGYVRISVDCQGVRTFLSPRRYKPDEAEVIRVIVEEKAVARILDGNVPYFTLLRLADQCFEKLPGGPRLRLMADLYAAIKARKRPPHIVKRSYYLYNDQRYTAMGGFPDVVIDGIFRRLRPEDCVEDVKYVFYDSRNNITYGYRYDTYQQAEEAAKKQNDKELREAILSFAKMKTPALTINLAYWLRDTEDK